MSEQSAENKQYVAVIRIRGPVNVRGEVEDTLKMLHLHRKNYCSVFPDSPSVRGMLRKVKDYVTFGVISEETYSLLKEKRGEKDKEGNLKPFFRLSPPRGGFERKGIKVPFKLGGALGDRGDKIKELIERML
ncbi:50S ribosomal protein L30 [Candidatus Woesearchaeota archaeon]|nr:MAG: 50S ribosomal protein L30 [Candidatus Woesearchaeota archaeon]